MLKLSYILRMVALSILFGGSIAVIVSAITLVKAAQAQGVATAVAATANAPMFMTFSSIVMVCGFLLLAGEALDYAKERKINKLVGVRYAASLIAVCATMILSFAVVPPMKRMLEAGAIHTTGEAETTWKTFHEASQIVFSVIILSSFVALVVPGFEKKNATLS
jgi:formate hydrogenlyase subunit 3/multisubunit Na+/H+ antiporter MnhD subunit